MNVAKALEQKAYFSDQLPNIVEETKETFHILKCRVEFVVECPNRDDILFETHDPNNNKASKIYICIKNKK